MANNYITVDMIAAEALMQLENSLVAANLMYRDKTADFGSVGGYRVGDSVNIKTRPDFEVQEFTSTTVDQEVRESKRALTIEKHFDVTIPYTDREMALSIDSLSEQLIAPAVTRIADKVDSYLLSKAWLARGLYAAATPLASAAEIAAARKIANEQQIPLANRIGIVNSSLEATLLGTDVFHKFDTRGEPGVNALQEASMGRLMGIDWYSSVNFTDSNYAPGSATATTDNGAGGNTNNRIGTSTLTFDAGSAAPFNAGDRLQIAGVYRPVIVASTVADASAATTVTLVDPIDELIPDNAAISVVGGGNSDLAYQGIILTPGSFAYAMPPLDSPPGAESAVVSANGLSLRVVRDYSQTTKTSRLSIDLLCGATAYDTRKSLIIADATA